MASRIVMFRKITVLCISALFFLVWLMMLRLFHYSEIIYQRTIDNNGIREQLNFFSVDFTENFGKRILFFEIFREITSKDNKNDSFSKQAKTNKHKLVMSHNFFISIVII